MFAAKVCSPLQRWACRQRRLYAMTVSPAARANASNQCYGWNRYMSRINYAVSSRYGAFVDVQPAPLGNTMYSQA